jgi:hypothetical protein
MPIDKTLEESEIRARLEQIINMKRGDAARRKRKIDWVWLDGERSDWFTNGGKSAQ